MENCIIAKDKRGNLTYNRYFHYYQTEVCNKLAQRYSIHHSPTKKFTPSVALFPSGMNAIDSLFQVLMINNKWKSINIICGSELYCDTPRVIKYLMKYIDINLIKINVIDSDKKIIEQISKNVKKDLLTLVYFESCSNPNGYIINYNLLWQIKSILKKLRIESKLIIDNTWLSSAILNPFKFDVDFVINSLTKYYGAGKSGIMGTILSRSRKFGKKIIDYGKIKGLHVCPLYCKELFKNLDTLDKRIKKSSETTIKVVNYLNQKIQVSHPYLKNHPSYNLSMKYYNGLGPSVFTFKIKLTKIEALKWMKQSKFKCLTSFGSEESKFDQWPQKTFIKNEEGSVCRFSVGYKNNSEDIIKEFDRLLSLLPK